MVSHVQGASLCLSTLPRPLSSILGSRLAADGDTLDSPELAAAEEKYHFSGLLVSNFMCEPIVSFPVNAKKLIPN